MSTGVPYTKEQLDWLRGHYPLLSAAELASTFNDLFGQTRTNSAIKATLGREKILSGRTGRIEKGAVSWNKGKRGYMGANTTSFKKGNRPHNTQYLGHERASKDGYIEISIAETNPHTGYERRYKCKHVWLWEQTNGPIPKSHAVIFRDGNNRNFGEDNLLLVTRAELLCLNLHRYHEQPAELKPSILALAKVEAVAGFRSRGRVPGAGRKKGTPNRYVGLSV